MSSMFSGISFVLQYTLSSRSIYPSTVTHSVLQSCMRPTLSLGDQLRLFTADKSNILQTPKSTHFWELGP